MNAAILKAGYKNVILITRFNIQNSSNTMRVASCKALATQWENQEQSTLRGWLALRTTLRSCP